MVSLEQFHAACAAINKTPDDEKRAAIDASAETPLFIVAGPGTGKTTCIVLRILKLIFVDGIAPSGILATTFTRKAAAELRSRVLGWGYQIQGELQKDGILAPHEREWVSRRDLNRVVTGTVDSICEAVLRDFREAGQQPPVLIDEFVAGTLMLRAGLFEDERHKDADLDAFLKKIAGSSGWGFNVGRKANLLQQIWDRRYQDQVNWDAFVKKGPKAERVARGVVGEAIAAYAGELQEREVVDFALLEHEVFTRLRAGKLGEFTRQLKVVLVDEYQDTNLLQESLYFELARACGGALTVVGDDDQSLYRFRGAAVVLFRDFSKRFKKVFKSSPKTVFLKTNYRSTRNVVSFSNRYARLDAGFQSERVACKPELVTPRTAEHGLPVLGLFRDDREELAKDLAKVVRDVFRGSGYRLPSGEVIKASAADADVGDCALLCSSPREYSTGGKERLPLLLRQELRAPAQKAKRIELFNPRGQDLTEIPLVRRFGGVLLECIDPKAEVQGSSESKLFSDVVEVFTEWREATAELSGHKDLVAYVKAWRSRKAPRGLVWPRSVSALELLYGLVHFFPELYDDPEGQVYLEVFTRQLQASQMVGTFDGDIVEDAKDNRTWKSKRELLRDFLGPIASGAVKVNEDLMELFPRDRLSVLSVHQAKGLEFPFVIVDVGSDFKTNSASQRFKRFPDKGGPAHALEDLLWEYTTLGKPARKPRDRAFDDLYRQFFVAVSRPQQVLLLAGLNASLPGGRIPNVATGSRRTGANGWAPIPFVKI